jgi:hypothetical protein
VLRGRSRDEPDKILATTKQDVEVALRQMQRAYSPSQLAAAEQVVARAIRRGEHSFYLRLDPLSALPSPHPAVVPRAAVPAGARPVVRGVESSSKPQAPSQEQ